MAIFTVVQDWTDMWHVRTHPQDDVTWRNNRKNFAACIARHKLAWPLSKVLLRLWYVIQHKNSAVLPSYIIITPCFVKWSVLSIYLSPDPKIQASWWSVSAHTVGSSEKLFFLLDTRHLPWVLQITRLCWPCLSTTPKTMCWFDCTCSISM